MVLIMQWLHYSHDSWTLQVSHVTNSSHIIEESSKTICIEAIINDDIFKEFDAKASVWTVQSLQLKHHQCLMHILLEWFVYLTNDWTAKENIESFYHVFIYFDSVFSMIQLLNWGSSSRLRLSETVMHYFPSPGASTLARRKTSV